MASAHALTLLSAVQHCNCLSSLYSSGLPTFSEPTATYVSNPYSKLPFATPSENLLFTSSPFKSAVWQSPKSATQNPIYQDFSLYNAYLCRSICVCVLLCSWERSKNSKSPVTAGGEGPVLPAQSCSLSQARTNQQERKIHSRQERHQVHTAAEEWKNTFLYLHHLQQLKRRFGSIDGFLFLFQPPVLSYTTDLALHYTFSPVRFGVCTILFRLLKSATHNPINRLISVTGTSAAAICVCAFSLVGVKPIVANPRLQLVVMEDKPYVHFVVFTYISQLLRCTSFSTSISTTSPPKPFLLNFRHLNHSSATSQPSWSPCSANPPFYSASPLPYPNPYTPPSLPFNLRLQLHLIFRLYSTRY